MTSGSPFAVRCTLTFGDIYGQVLAWMAVIFVSLAAGLALMGSTRPVEVLGAKPSEKRTPPQASTTETSLAQRPRFSGL